MPVLKRQDDVQFAIRPYRETLSTKIKPSLLKNEIRLLARNHGQHVRLFQLPQQQLEAVFSDEPGYLLGETIWQYFGKTPNLIYCEALSDGRHALLVVVRDSSIYLDDKILISDLQSELASLTATQSRYQIHAYGIEQTIFDPSYIQQYQALNASVINSLMINDELRLQPLEYAIAQLKLTQTKTLVWTAVTAAIIMVVIWWLLQPAAPKQIVQITPQRNPYALYHASLNQPPANEQIQAAVNAITLAYTIPGWQPQKITLNQQHHIHINIDSNGGTAKLLLHWANKHNVPYRYLSQGAELLITPHFSKQQRKLALANNQQVLAQLLDRINILLTKSSVRLGNSYRKDAVIATKATITFSMISPDVLTLLGDEFYRLPVKLTNLSATTQRGLLSGRIQLTIFGASA